MTMLVELAVRRMVEPKDTPLMNTSTEPSPRRNTITLVTPASASNVNGARKKRLLAALAEAPQLPSEPCRQPFASKFGWFQFLLGEPAKKGMGVVKATGVRHSTCSSAEPMSEAVT